MFGKIGKKNNFNDKKEILNKENDASVLNKESIVKPKKIKKIKEIWDGSYKIKSIGFPELINPEFKSNKKYKIHLDYYDKNKKLHRKTVRFGKKTDSDFLDHKVQTKKNKLCAKLGNTHNMFHGNYWRWHLLNGEGTLKNNWMELIKDI